MGSPTKPPYTVSAIIHIYFVRKPMRAHIMHENPCSHDSHAYNLKRMQLSLQMRAIHIHIWSFVDCHSTMVGYTSWTFLCAALWHSYNMKGTFHSPDWVNIHVREIRTPLVHIRRCLSALKKAIQTESHEPFHVPLHAGCCLLLNVCYVCCPGSKVLDSQA